MTVLVFLGKRGHKVQRIVVEPEMMMHLSNYAWLKGWNIIHEVWQ